MMEQPYYPLEVLYNEQEGIHTKRCFNISRSPDQLCPQITTQRRFQWCGHELRKRPAILMSPDTYCNPCNDCTTSTRQPRNSWGCSTQIQDSILCDEWKTGTPSTARTGSGCARGWYTAIFIQKRLLPAADLFIRASLFPVESPTRAETQCFWGYS